MKNEKSSPRTIPSGVRPNCSIMMSFFLVCVHRNLVSVLLCGSPRYVMVVVAVLCIRKHVFIIFTLQTQSRLSSHFALDARARVQSVCVCSCARWRANSLIFSVYTIALHICTFIEFHDEFQMRSWFWHISFTISFFSTTMHVMCTHQAHSDNNARISLCITVVSVYLWNGCSIQRSNSVIWNPFSALSLHVDQTLCIFDGTFVVWLALFFHLCTLLKILHFPNTSFIFRIYLPFLCNRAINCQGNEMNQKLLESSVCINGIATSWRLHWIVEEKKFYWNFYSVHISYHNDLNFSKLRKMKYVLLRLMKSFGICFLHLLSCLSRQKNSYFHRAANRLQFVCLHFSFNFELCQSICTASERAGKCLIIFSFVRNIIKQENAIPRLETTHRLMDNGQWNFSVMETKTSKSKTVY